MRSPAAMYSETAGELNALATLEGMKLSSWATFSGWRSWRPRR